MPPVLHRQRNFCFDVHAGGGEPTPKGSPAAATAEGVPEVKKGTGVFMPLTMRTPAAGTAPPGGGGGWGGGGKHQPYGRRRNVSTGCLVDGSGHEPSRRSISSSNLAARLPGGRGNLPPPHPGGTVLMGMSIAEEQHYHAGLLASALATSAPSGGLAHPMQLGLAGLPASPPGLSQPTSLQQQLSLQQSLGPQASLSQQPSLQQQLSQQPSLQQQLMQLNSTSTSPRTSNAGTTVSSDTAELLALSGVLAPANSRHTGELAGVACGSNGQISAQALQTFYGPSTSLAAPYTAADLLPGLPSASRSFAAAQPSNGLPGTNNSSPLASPTAGSFAAAATGGSSAAIGHQPSFSKWALLNGLEQLQASGSGGADTVLEQHEEQIQKRIDELIMMKQLLQLKHQHKQQQASLQQEQLKQQQLLQMQQLQQKQLLQQQLLQAQRSDSSSTCSGRSITVLQKELALQQQQMLQVQHSDASSSSQGRSPSLTALQHELLLQVQGSDSSGSGSQGKRMVQMQQELLQSLRLQAVDDPATALPTPPVSCGSSLLLARSPSQGVLQPLGAPVEGHGLACVQNGRMHVSAGASPFVSVSGAMMAPAGDERDNGANGLGGSNIATMSAALAAGRASSLQPWASGASLASSTSGFLFGAGADAASAAGERSWDVLARDASMPLPTSLD